MFKRSISYRMTEDSDFEHNIMSYAENMDYGAIGWYPSQGKVVYRDDVKLPVSTPGQGINDFLSCRPYPASLAIAARAAENQMEQEEDAKARCLKAKVRLYDFFAAGMGLKNTNNHGSSFNFTGYPVIGYQHHMQASGSCLDSPEDNLETVCVWDPRIPGILYQTTSLSIPFSNITDFVADVKWLHDANPDALCIPELYYGGIHMRFLRNSSAYLGKPYDSVDIDLTYYRSRDTPNQPRIHEDVIEEIEQMLVFKYKGLPHYGKNRHVGFIGVRDKLGEKGDEFVRVMKKYDEQGLFSSDWSDGVLGISSIRGNNEKKEIMKNNNELLQVLKRGCGIEGLCICRNDEHCDPKRGYHCQPGLVYNQARVCRKVTTIGCQ